MHSIYIYDISHLRVKLSDFTVRHHTLRKTKQTAQFWQAIAQASELSFPVVFHTENYAFHSGNPTVSSVYLPTPRWHHLISSNSFSRWASHDIFLFKCHVLLHILRFLFFFSDKIIADVAGKQQMTALFLSTTVTRTRRHTELIQKTWWETCAVPENIQFSFLCSILHS
jgi:hypothetical protein